MNLEYMKDVKKTKPCNSILLNGFCLKGAKCNFAHSKFELKCIECNFGLSCKHFSKSACNYFHKDLETKNEWMERVNICFPNHVQIDHLSILQHIGSKKRIKHDLELFKSTLCLIAV